MEQLTPEEEALIPTVREEWLKTGLATGPTSPTDREVAQAAIADIYRQARREPPHLWIWLGSPSAGCIGAGMLGELFPYYPNYSSNWASIRAYVRAYVWAPVRACVRPYVRTQVQAQVGKQLSGQVHFPIRAYVGNQVGEQVWKQVSAQVLAPVQAQVRDEVWEQVSHEIQAQLGDDLGGRYGGQRGWAVYGQHDAGELAFYDMFLRMKVVNWPEQLEPLMRLATVAGWWWPFEGACIITERPTVLHRDEAGRLHCDSGPALAYPDNWAIHSWHGRRIPAWLIDDTARLTPDTIEAEGNTELRRVMLEIFGFDKYIEARGATLIAEDECLGLPRQLFEIRLHSEPVRMLRVVNGTVEPDGGRRQFHLSVPWWCSTPHEAVAWSYGRPAQLHTEAVRT
jgi:hypothetical protein